MNNLIKLAAVGLAGYFIGFYEMKYKVMKTMLDGIVENNLKESQQEEESK